MTNKITSENEELVKKLLDEVFDNFDFERVKKVMDALNWTWDFEGLSTDYICKVPTLDEIKETAANLMWEVVNDADTKSRCYRGFRVDKDFSDPYNPWLCLAFDVELHEAFGQDFED